MRTNKSPSDSSEPSESDLIEIEETIRKMKNRKNASFFHLTREHKLYAACLLVVFFLLFWSLSSSSPKMQFACIIDAGSTGSRIHVYPYAKTKPLITLYPELYTHKKKPGLSSFADNPFGVTDEMKFLLEKAREFVPAGQRPSTPIFLRATAGMRKVRTEFPEKATKVMEMVRRVFEDSEFLFQDDFATIIEGSDEGLYGWITANYLNSYLKGHEKDASSTGVLEMGGESVQLTFIPDENQMQYLPKNLLTEVQLGPKSHNVFVYSWMGQGLEAIIGRHMEKVDQHDKNPCILDGDNRQKTHAWNGEGDYEQCVGGLEEFVGSSQDCKEVTGIKCAMDGVQIPKIDTEKFYFIENFFYTLNTFKTSPNGMQYIKEMASNGKDYCGKSFDVAKKDYQIEEDWEVEKTCYGTAWIKVILGALGLDEYSRFEVVRNVNGGDIDWAVGYIIKWASAQPDATSSYYVYIILGVAIIGAVFVYVRRKGMKVSYQPVNQYPI